MSLTMNRYAYVTAALCKVRERYRKTHCDHAAKECQRLYVERKKIVQGMTEDTINSYKANGHDVLSNETEDNI